MSIHRSLRAGSDMTKHRNVLTRVERLEKLEANGKWKEEDTVTFLPKVRSIKVALKKKKKKTDDEE